MTILLVLLWFLCGFMSWIYFTYQMRVGPYTLGDVFISLLFSFTGPLMTFLLLIAFMVPFLSKYKITKD